MMYNRNPKERIDGALLAAQLAEDAENAPPTLPENRNRMSPPRHRRGQRLAPAGRMTDRTQISAGIDESGEERLDEEVRETREEECSCARADALSCLPLAMVYMPDQEWRNLYGEDEALCRGTLFSELDFPFCAGCGR